MLLSLKLNNCLIFNSEVEFSMKADMRYKRFYSNIAKSGDVSALKTAILIGPNNSGKSNFIRAMALLKNIMLGKENALQSNLFTNDSIIDISLSFLDSGEENLFEIKFDDKKKEFIYERFATVTYDKYKNSKTTDLLIRDTINRVYYSTDEGLSEVMKMTSKTNILIYLIDTDIFPELNKIKEKMIRFASKIDIVDMNNIPIKKTIDILKSTDGMNKKISDFVLNSDLYLEDFRYLSDEEVKIELHTQETDELKIQENALTVSAPLNDMLHLASVYKGKMVPSVFYDSVGTKKMASLAGYIIDALENGRILFIDELDNSLHFKLTRAIISLFNNELNKTKAQLIATVHDVSLLDCQSLFRKEQIWFTHKDVDNVYLYSLAEYTNQKDKVRDTTDIIDRYKKGMFGALPEPDLFQSLLEVTQDV